MSAALTGSPTCVATAATHDAQLVASLNAEDATVAAAVARAGDELAAAIDAIAERLARGGRLVYVGAGTSGRLAALDAAECRADVRLAARRGRRDRRRRRRGGRGRRGRAATPTLRALGVGADDAVVARQRERLDAVHARRARGRARGGRALRRPRVRARQRARRGRRPRDRGRRRRRRSSPGSTRLKAGTAQKLVLNTISTVTMIRLGRTYAGLMVGVAPENAKLRERARRNVVLASGRPEADVDAALAAAEGDARVALVALLAGVDPATRARAARRRGRLRRVALGGNT